MDVTIFSNPGCRLCVATKNKFETKGIPVHEVVIDELPEEYQERVKGIGYTALPIVMVYTSDEDEVPEVWSGYRPEIIRELVA
ncbi:hypothetical protein Wildcat_53 [Mycobacterium phage Wildcat]|uniref:Glutaredoxin domain-containing protein n=3 Tax=Mycobacterium virus Wildcat TaxID=1993859 RepID=Q19Y07_9CAUD|nr:hypothetical protein Wildcat_53 [Mycobacterium phage Wildcat]ABE67658.1 hypothetical protein Wildcat_53 [Mycobacterium phage Wildcat]AQT25725.1 glutaredoxin [Mycobacterium phage EniyanLRS]QGJ89943.1 glutaredoxin [Mycobacterium phage MaryV]WKR36063.1 NrdH [Mycobacterium phage Azrael100]